ncbi:armadillo-type protein [Mycena polygramma]|nr:armadillo-type protein [Mycena polygramma]
MDGPPPVEEDFSTLPIAERLAHKNWKARVNGYEALVKVFQATGSDTDPAFRPYINNPDLLKKIATDSNTVAQEKGVECLVTLVKYAGESAAKTRDTVVPALVDKCFGSTRAGTKTQAVELALQYVEVQNGGSGVVTDLLPGLSAKQPKTVAGCVLALKEILRLFGTQTTPPPPILKALPKIFSHSDKTVRAEGTSLTHVLYQYLGPGIEPWLADLKPVQVKGLKEAFDAMEAAGNGKGTLKPERLTRAHARQVEAAGDDGMEAVAENEEDAAPLDPLAFVEPVDVKLPPSLQTLLTSSKWEERKEVLDDLLTLLNSTPRIKDGPEIGELSKSLAIRIQGDANINCVMTAAACMQALAKAMLGSFARYRELVVGPMLERLKERKANVTDSIGDALDAVFSSTTLSDIIPDLGCLSTASSPIQPAQIKPLAETLAILLEDGFEGARTEAATCLGTLMKMVGERPLNPVMEGLPDMRKSKVKEAFEWATVKCKAGAAAPPKAAPLPVAAPAPKKKAPAPKPAAVEDEEPPKKPVAKPPAKAPAKKAPPVAAAPVKKAPVSSAVKSSKAPTSAAPAALDTFKYKHTPEDAEAIASETIPSSILKDLADANWKTRLAALDEMTAWVEGEIATVDAEVVVRALAKKGWAEKNFQVSAKIYAICSLLAERCPSFGRSCPALCIAHLSEKLGDLKLKKPAGDTLLVFAEKTSLRFVLNQAYDPLSKQKAPKVLADALTWINTALMEFGIVGLSLRSLIEFLKTALQNSNAAVRTSATKTLVTVKLFAGSSIKDFLEDLNAQLLNTINTEFDKVEGNPAPEPSRTSADLASMVASSSTSTGAGASGDPLDDLFPRVEVDGLLKGTTILADAKNDSWKTKKEGLEALQSILDQGSNKRLKSSMGDIGQVLKARVTDTNKAVQNLALDIVARIATGMGKPFEKHSRLFTCFEPREHLQRGDWSGIRTHALSEKLGDLKLKKPAGDTLLVFAEKTSLRFVLNQAYDPLSKQKAPKVLADALTWINTALMEFGIVGLSLRSLIEFLKTALQNSNAAVRTSATKTLVTVKLFAGSSIKDFLEDLNAQLLNTINTEFDKVEGNPAPEPSRTSADLASMVASSSTSTGAGASGDPLDDLFPRVEVDGLLKGTTILADAKNDSWKTKKEGLEALQSILDQGSNKRLKSSMGDIGQVLKARVTDTNKAVQNLALDIVARIATGMGKPFEKHSRLFTVLPVAVLSDQKAPIRAAAIKALTAIAAAREGLDSMVQGLHTALEMSNPLQKGTLMHWIADWFGEHELASSLDLSSWTPAIVCSLDDRSPDVRKGAQALLPTLISSVGYDHVIHQTNSLKPASRNSAMPRIQAARASAPRPRPASQAKALLAAVSVAQTSKFRYNKLGVRRKLPQGSSRPDSRADTPVELPPSRSSKTPVGGLRRPGATSSAKTSAPSTPPPSLALPFSGTSSDAKKARLGKDASKWINEGGPTRKDLADLLQTQMELHTSKDLVARWFSHDHNAVNDHLSGLTTICDLFTTAQGADAAVEAVCLANFDLPLKYASIKLHEPQPNLVSKCLEVVETVLAFLRSVNYQLTDNEALCFIPTVVYKLGDAREPVRVRVQQIMQEIPKVYAYSRLFQILLEHGLKSKVAKTRQGALDEMGGILKKSGMAACEPSKGFPIIAGMISGKDSQVRKSALGALGEGYTLLGEKVWTLVGPLPAKDKTQLEEPLRRVPGPSNSETPAPPAQVSRLAAARLGLPRPKFPSGVAREPAPAPEPRVLSPPPSGSSKIHEEIETSLSEGSDDITITISSIQLSSDPTRSVDALKKIQKILAVGPDAGPSSPQYRELAEHTEGLIETITLQMAHVFDRPEDLVPEENFRLAKHLVQTLNTFCDHAFLAESLTADILTSLLEELTLRLLETDDSTIKKVKDLSRFINMIVLRLFATGRRMSIFRALFALLLQIVKPFPGNGTAPDSKESKVAELVLKCVWKLARNIPQDLTEERLDPVELFPAIEHFLQSVPPNEWRARATNKVPCGDMPLRTIKVIIQHVVGPYKFTESSLFIYGGSSGHTSAAQGIATAGTQPVEVRRHGIRPVVLH